MSNSWKYADLSFSSDDFFTTVKLTGYGINLRNGTAHDLADWIKANVPEQVDRDRESDMRNLAGAVLEFLMGFPGDSINTALAYKCGARIGRKCDGLDIMRFLDPHGAASGDYSVAEIKYGQSLIDDLPQWIHDRALGIGGE